MLPAHEPLDREDRVFGIGDGLPLGDLTNEPFAVFGETDHGRRDAGALLVDDDGGLPAFHHGNDRVGRAEVDSDDFASCRHFIGTSIPLKVDVSIRTI